MYYSSSGISHCVLFNSLEWQRARDIYFKEWDPQRNLPDSKLVSSMALLLSLSLSLCVCMCMCVINNGEFQ